ncbi:hypothetical protein [Pseudomonas sp. S9]|uniref:hypothetical protein n=1 Tax=Pseudomonas sp. S9 TaxID=686578 RepID=UPI0002556DC5|nr:hypothetical protein [Pseudomonas sp. S9]
MSEVKRCAACGKEKPVIEMKVCMHNQMHQYVCDSKCMSDFYNLPKKQSAKEIEEMVAKQAQEIERLNALLSRDPNVIVNELRQSRLSIDTPNQYKQDLIDCIIGAMAFGFQNTNPPPEGHWGKQFWGIGREEGKRQEELTTELEQLKKASAGVDKREAFEAAYSGEYATPISVLKLLRDGDAYLEKSHHSDRLNSSWWMWKQARAQLSAPSSIPATHVAVERELPPFAQKIIAKLKRFEECTDDGQDADIGRHWLFLLTQLGLLNRIQRSPAMWEISQQGEDAILSSKGGDQS